jgi:L-ascorbate metabolism protein UlaG (beta-lactamase superfamily)
VRLAAQPGGPPRYLVGLGLKRWFEARGIQTAVELDWWDSRVVKGVTIHFVPTQHWSERTNLQHYHVPVNVEVHEVETTFVEEDDTVVNALGVKGMGELGMAGIPAAIANTVFHAMGRRIRELPITPDKLL